MTTEIIMTYLTWGQRLGPQGVKTRPEVCGSHLEGSIPCLGSTPVLQSLAQSGSRLFQKVMESKRLWVIGATSQMLCVIRIKCRIKINDHTGKWCHQQHEFDFPCSHPIHVYRIEFNGVTLKIREFFRVKRKTNNFVKIEVNPNM